MKATFIHSKDFVKLPRQPGRKQLMDMPLIIEQHGINFLINDMCPEGRPVEVDASLVIPPDDITDAVERRRYVIQNIKDNYLT